MAKASANRRTKIKPVVPANARSEKAWRAVAEFRKMLPSMTAFARMLTGDKGVSVHVGKDSGASTLDNRIFIAPPIELGELLKHQRHYCNQRGYDGCQICDACAARERILFHLYHEVAHIVGKSFDEPLEYLIEKLKAIVDDWHPLGACTHGDTVKAMIDEYRFSYKGAMTMVNPLLPVIFNDLEDSRVDASMLRARPGLKPMFRSGILRIFENGIPLPSGELIAWTQQPINAQVAIGMFLMSSGYGIEPEWFDPRVIEVLGDAELNAICDAVVLTNSSHQVAELTIRTFQRMHELGLFPEPKCEVPPPPPPVPPSGSSDDNEEKDDKPDEEQSSDQSDNPGGDGGDPGDSSDDESGDDESDDGGSSTGGSDDDDSESGEPDDGTDPGSKSGSESGDTESGDADTESGDEPDDKAGSKEDKGETGDAASEDGGPSGGDPDDPGGDSDEDGEAGTGGSDPGDGESGTDGQSPDPGSEDDDAGRSDEDGSGDVGEDRPESGDGNDAEDRADGSEPGSELGTGSPTPGDDEGQGSPGVGDDREDAPDMDLAEAAESDGASDQEGQTGQDQDSAGSQPSTGSASDPDGGESEPDLGLGEDDAESGLAGQGDIDGERNDRGDQADGDPGTEGDRTEASESEDAGDSSEPGSEASGTDGSDVDGGEEGGAPEGIDDGSSSDVWDQDYDNEQLGPVFEPEELGTPEEVAEILDKLTGHRHEGDDETLDPSAVDGHDDLRAEIDRLLDEEAVLLAIGQSFWFATRSQELHGMQVIQYPEPKIWWPYGSYAAKVHDWTIPEALLGKSLMHARLTFEANRRAKHQPNLRGGKINPRVLGRRAPVGDDRLFHKTIIPAKRSYFVMIVVDCSGSTMEFERNPRIKRAVLAQAIMLSRLGIPFAIYGMTGGADITAETINWHEATTPYVWALEVKRPEEPWTDKVKQRLIDLPPVAENYDGHNMEFARKILDRRQETNRIIIYYTDGAMPAANAAEELEILSTELEYAKRNIITVLGVGINTDSPSAYGLNTVRVDSDADLHNVVVQLGKALEE